jgi:hypothetical protein
MGAISAIPDAAEHATRQAAPWIEKLARLGFLSKAVLYMTAGALALAVATGMGGEATGMRGAMLTVLSAPFGKTLLVIIGIGMFGYAAFRIIEGIMDPVGRGRSAKAIARRLALVGTGIIHAGLALSAVRIAMGDLAAARDGEQSRHWAGRALASDAGKLTLWAVALSLVVYGLYQLYCAYKAKLDKRLALGGMSATTRRWVIGVSRFGIAARGVVFGMAGILVVRAVQNHDARQVGGPGEALKALTAYGKLPFAIIAAGLIAYGIYQFIEARYRRIDVA